MLSKVPAKIQLREDEDSWSTGPRKRLLERYFSDSRSGKMSQTVTGGNWNWFYGRRSDGRAAVRHTVSRVAHA